jgi:hypothetical protein
MSIDVKAPLGALPAYSSSAECRAYVVGVVAVVNALRASAAEHWGMGRESYDLDQLRDALVAMEVQAAQMVTLAHEHEKAER